jgi:hypothetical protein
MIDGAKERLRTPLRIRQDGDSRIRVEANRRYSLMSVAGGQFAYSDPAEYLRALGRAWSAGLQPEPLPSALGEELPEVAPDLLGVDSPPC